MEKYIVYLTVNTVNKKIYVGVHRTQTPYKFDGYIGCGVYVTKGDVYPNAKYPMQRAYNKYGAKAFTRYTLLVFDNKEEALEAEKSIVNAEFVKDPKTYNAAIGGGGFRKDKKLKKVHQYSLEGVFMKTFDSIREAATECNPENIDAGYATIKANAIGTFESAYGFRWSYKLVNSLPKKKNRKGSPRKVYQYELDGKFIKEFRTLAQAVKEVKAKASAGITSCCKGQRYTAHGFQWSFEKKPVMLDLISIMEEQGKDSVTKLRNIR